MPLRSAPRDGELAFISTADELRHGHRVTVSELAIESFFPADDETARFVRAWSERA